LGLNDTEEERRGGDVRGGLRGELVLLRVRAPPVGVSTVLVAALLHARVNEAEGLEVGVALTILPLSDDVEGVAFDLLRLFPRLAVRENLVVDVELELGDGGGFHGMMYTPYRGALQVARVCPYDVRPYC
jgi:hypothetical protein